MLAPAQVMNEDRILFLQSLSTEVDYLAMIQWLHMCKVSNCVELDDVFGTKSY